VHGIPTAGRNPFSVFFGWFLFWLFVLFFWVLFWFVLSLMGLPTGVCIGLPTTSSFEAADPIDGLASNYNSACLLRLNVCNDLAKAMKALDGKKQLGLTSDIVIEIELYRPNASLLLLEGLPRRKCPCVTPLSANGCPGFGLLLWTKVSKMAIIMKLLHLQPFSSLLLLCM